MNSISFLRALLRPRISAAAIDFVISIPPALNDCEQVLVGIFIYQLAFTGTPDFFDILEHAKMTAEEFERLVCAGGVEGVFAAIGQFLRLHAALGDFTKSIDHPLRRDPSLVRPLLHCGLERLPNTKFC